MGGYGWDDSVIFIGKNSSTISIPNDPLLNVKRDYHRVTSASNEFNSRLNSSSSVNYKVTVYYGSSEDASGPFSIDAEGVNVSSILSSSAGQFKEFIFPIRVSNGELNLEFIQSSGMNISLSGIIIESFCGDSVRVNPEVCDSGDEGATGKRFGNQEYSGTCIIDLNYYTQRNIGGLLCQRNNVCGDGYRNSTEQCDDGNTQNGDSCPSNCRLSNEEQLFCSQYVDVVGMTWINGSEIVPAICGDYNRITQNDMTSAGVSGQITLLEYKKRLCNSCSAGTAFGNDPGAENLDDLRCSWNTQSNTCVLIGNNNQGTTCTVREISSTECAEGQTSRTVSVSSSCDPACSSTEGCPRVIPCPRTIQLPLFSFWNFIISILIIVSIYLVLNGNRK